MQSMQMNWEGGCIHGFDRQKASRAGYMARNYIKKLYLAPIRLVDPGSTQSTQIHLGVLLIHLRVPQLAPGLLWSKPEPTSKLGSMSEYSDRIWIFVCGLGPDLASLWSMPEQAYWSGSLSRYSDWILSALNYARASFLIWIFAWVLGLDLALLWSMPELAARSRSLIEFSD